MRFLLFLLVALPVMALEDSSGVTWYRDTGVFQPLEKRAVAVSPDGHVYIVNFQDAVINHYGPNGEKLDDIGSKGKGPGEYTYIVNIFFQGGKLWVDDLLDAQMSVVDVNGKFEKRYKQPQRGLHLARTSKGWIYGTWSSWMMDDKSRAKLMMTGDDFKNPKQLLELKDKTVSQGAMVFSNDGKTKAFFNPITTHPQIMASPDGSKVFVSDPWLFKITVYDADGNSSVIERKAKRIPFDLDWGKDRLKETNDEDKRNTYTADFPDYFPVIRQLILDPKGNLVVDRWRGRPDEKNYPITIDMKGNELEQAFEWEMLSRLVGVAGDHVYITVFDSESEEAGIARVPVDQANAFAKANPIEFDGSRGYSISISN